MRFLNGGVLPRKALNCNLSWGVPLGNLLPKTRVLKHRILERKRRPNANASVLGKVFQKSNHGVKSRATEIGDPNLPRAVGNAIDIFLIPSSCGEQMFRPLVGAKQEDRVYLKKTLVSRFERSLQST